MRLTSFISFIVIAATFAAAVPVPTTTTETESELVKTTNHDLSDEHHPHLVARTPEKTKAQHLADATASDASAATARQNAQTSLGHARTEGAASKRKYEQAAKLEDGHVDKERLKNEAAGHKRNERQHRADATEFNRQADQHDQNAAASRLLSLKAQR